jgi:nitrogen regulatory protein PII
MNYLSITVEIEDNNERKTGLRRRDTPYYKKNKRIIKDDQSRDKVLEILAQIAAKKEGGDGQVIHTEVTDTLSLD